MALGDRRVIAGLIERVAETPAVQSVLRRLEEGGAWSCGGLGPGAQPFFTVLLRHLFPRRPIVVVTEGLKAQESFHQDVSTWQGLLAGAVEREPSRRVTAGGPEGCGPGWEPLFYPGWEVLPHEGKLPHPDVIGERLATLLRQARASEGAAAAPLVVTCVAALQQRTFPAEELRHRTRPLRRGDRLNPLDLVEWLETQSYEPEARVTQRGEIALRGGILDIYPPTSPWPVRLEFFGDELESMRFFDPQTQISREPVESVTLPPAGELGILRKTARSREGLATLLDYLPGSSMILFCEPERLTAQATAYAQQVPTGDPLFAEWEVSCAELEAKGCVRLELREGEEAGSLGLTGWEAFRPIIGRAPEPVIAERQRREFFAQLHRWLRHGYHVHVFGNNTGECARFQELWREYSLDETTPAGQAEAASGAACLEVAVGRLTAGFISEAARLAVVTDAEIFGRYKVQRPRRLKSAHAQAMRSALDLDFTELDEGDYVVHLQYGIGRYLGLRTLRPDRRQGTVGWHAEDGAAPPEVAPASGQECLLIEYAPSDPGQPPPKLYVPVTEAHLVSKYIGASKARPLLNTLGGTRWVRAKAQAERAVRDLAAELLALQAARATQPGHVFGQDTAWQGEFEASFLYEETPDQLSAIAAAKGDMESGRPMDRLVCGDVGFGKTEVALRATFKAVMGGKQVAVLVPTTVLAQQHFNTFRERMADYPIRVELLSRFRRRGEQQRVAAALAAGGVDIVIGTHRLLQADIAFKDLGLVVIDEEQRFGVAHKERLKQLRRLVHVLTLSATPIPRTLYLALTGARDMSTIETPPQDRLPVETVVIPYDEEVIRNAICRELNRQGQVFFLHNRVDTIETVAHRLRALVPEARVVVGHGQMESDRLEEAMLRFVNGEADVLLSTTIIESGLDIPNANTILIDRADRFGLSDLYQLRGRVGRYKHQAYAYFLLPRHAGLLSDARKRISAIKQYSSLGSGFKIALRDLEIRGAGNLLGPEQSGHITAVGFDLYCQLLEQSIRALKGEKVNRRVEVQVRFGFLAGFDGAGGLDLDQYVADPQQRVEIYRRLAAAGDTRSLNALRAEVRDRFGPLSKAVELRFRVAALKLAAAARGITAMETRGDRLMLKRGSELIVNDGRFPRLTKRGPRARLNEIGRLLAGLPGPAR